MEAPAVYNCQSCSGSCPDPSVPSEADLSAYRAVAALGYEDDGYSRPDAWRVYTGWRAKNPGRHWKGRPVMVRPGLIIAMSGVWLRADPASPRPCRFCGRHGVELTDRLGRGECVDTAACQGRELAAGLVAHKAIYAKGPVNDPDGPLCPCGRRVFDPIHRDDWREETRRERDARLTGV